MFDVPKPSLATGLRQWWRGSLAHGGFLRSLRTFLGMVLNFLTDSTPARRRQRYCDVEYDWDYRVDTTSATVGWRDRLLGLLHTPYQPSEPGPVSRNAQQLAGGLS
jgi:hypothetical protein